MVVRRLIIAVRDNARVCQQRGARLRPVGFETFKSRQ
jgi:hypothetical protein